MKLKSVEFAFIKAFKTLRFDLEKTSVLIGQNDHGKSSILKVIDIVLNQLDEETLKLGALHPDRKGLRRALVIRQGRLKRLSRWSRRTYRWGRWSNNTCNTREERNRAHNTHNASSSQC